MKLTEKILVAITVLSIVLKMFLVTGASILFVFSIQLLTMMYFVFSFLFFNGIRLRNIFKKESYAGISAMRLIGAIVTGICLSNLLTGILFRFQYWPGATATLAVSLAATLVTLVVVLIKATKNKDDYYPRILLRLTVTATLAGILLFLPELTLMKIQYRDHPAYINAYENYKMHPTDETERSLDIEYKRATMSPEDFKMHEEMLKNKGE